MQCNSIQLTTFFVGSEAGAGQCELRQTILQQFPKHKHQIRQHAYTSENQDEASKESITDHSENLAESHQRDENGQDGRGSQNEALALDLA